MQWAIQSILKNYCSYFEQSNLFKKKKNTKTDQMKLQTKEIFFQTNILWDLQYTNSAAVEHAYSMYNFRYSNHIALVVCVSGVDILSAEDTGIFDFDSSAFSGYSDGAIRSTLSLAKPPARCVRQSYSGRIASPQGFLRHVPAEPYLCASYTQAGTNGPAPQKKMHKIPIICI